MVFQRCASVLLVLLCSIARAELSDPVMISASGIPIDVERRGAAAPFFGDFDGDGIRDLLVGAYGKPEQCEMRVYPNIGEDGGPEFGDCFQFMNDKDKFRNTAFHPQLIDFDDNGKIDVLTASWPGQVRWFPRTETGFGTAKLLQDEDGDVIQLDWIHSAFAVDWDGDNAMDVVAGAQVRGEQGNVCVLKNNGDGKFTREMLSSNGEKLKIAGLLDLVVSDWDGNGTMDLVVGRNNGSVAVYLDSGTGDEPHYSKPVEILRAPDQDDLRGGSARVCVTDWNKDGKLDLLVGDTGAKFTKELDLNELDRKERAIEREKEAFASWAEHYQMLRTLRTKKGGDAELSRRLMKVARQGIRDSKAIMESAWQEHQSIKPGEQRHGRVWLCLRK